MRQNPETEDATAGPLWEDAEPSEPQEERDGDAEEGALLAAAGVTQEELATCVSVLQRLDAARAGLDWQASALRRLRKALAPHCREAFGQLPQKDALDARERAKFEKLQKRERRQRQLDADRRWKENAQLRASRLAQLQALEGAAGAGAPAPEGSAGPLADAHAPASAGGDADAEPLAPSPAPAPRRIPDGPAQEGAEPSTAEAGAEYMRQQACYICKARFSECHHFYSHLCPACAALNFEKRHQEVDLHGYVCLVTGGRVKIGFQTALKLLRMGARVIVTSRFPQDARRRYEAEADAGDWSGRLEVLGADFRFLGAVEALCEHLCARERWLDVLVNNACQTVRRPAAYYRHLLEAEGGAGAIAAGGPRAAAALADAGAGAVAAGAGGPAAPAPGPGEGGAGGSAAMSQLAVLAEDRLAEEAAALALPEGERDVHGQQLDLRATNSWLLRLGEVSTPEAVEVFCINALAPLVLNGRLRPLLECSPRAARFVVNVSAMEGKFYRYKQPTHPHTNMAKAALNMMTRTSAEDLARTSGIFMNSVDTGWINDENPLPTAQRIAADHGFQTPIDEVDAAARILDPVVIGLKLAGDSLRRPGEASAPEPQRPRRAGAGGGGGGGGGPAGAGPRCGAADAEPPWGRFFKDYAPTEW